MKVKRHITYCHLTLVRQCVVSSLEETEIREVAEVEIIGEVHGFETVDADSPPAKVSGGLPSPRAGIYSGVAPNLPDIE